MQMPLVAGSFIRPLLTASKKQLIDYLVSRDLEWREDSSNQQKQYLRNKVRLDVMPLLADIAGGENALFRRLQALSDQSHETKEIVDHMVRST